MVATKKEIDGVLAGSVTEAFRTTVEGKKIPQDLGQIQEMRTSRVERLAVILIDVKTHGLVWSSEH